jgi:hypothetical protein
MSLPAVVRGRNALGREFEEQTEISALNAGSARFSLDERILIGAKIWLMAEIPQTVLLKVALKLNLAGSVTMVQAQKRAPKRQVVSIRLDKHFRLYGLNP